MKGRQKLQSLSIQLFFFLFQKFMCDLKGPVAQMNVRVNDILVSGKLDYATGKS